MEFVIDEQGFPVDIRVIDSTKPGVFDEVAIKALSGWQFKPRVVDGAPVSRRATIPIEFRQEGCE
jgi:protein TonB